ncbi:hypothetical protein MCOR25_006177 [Pyricularia grisea]|nr:hypothetical protein MCOR25_006177 [Pyricularia grisea]
MNLNLSASLNIFKLIANPALCLPHATVNTFNDLPLPLGKALKGGKDGAEVDIKAVVLDKDDCFAYPETNGIHEPYKDRFAALKAAYPGRRLLIVSNTAGALSHDPKRKLAQELEEVTGVTVLSHKTKKPGCGGEIMEYFRAHPDTGVTSPAQIAVVGDRLSTDMMLANMMGSWGVWVKDGVAPMQKKSIVSAFSSLGSSYFPLLHYAAGYAASLVS